MRKWSYIGRKRRRSDAPIYIDMALTYNIGAGICPSHPNRLISYRAYILGTNEEVLKKIRFFNRRRATVDKYHRLMDHNDY